MPVFIPETMMADNVQQDGAIDGCVAIMKIVLNSNRLSNFRAAIDIPIAGTHRPTLVHDPCGDLNATEYTSVNNATTNHNGITSFQSVAIHGADLRTLHASVAKNYGRIEVNDGDDCCVLISKAELACMEEALEIFASLPGADAVRKHIEALAGDDCRRTSDILRHHHERAASKSKLSTP